MMKKMNKILVSAAVCGILAANVGVSAYADYIPPFVTGTSASTAESEDETSAIPADSIIDSEETTISSEIVSETTIPVIDFIGGSGDTDGTLTKETDDDDIDDFDKEDYYDPALKGNASLVEDVTNEDVVRQFITVKTKNGNVFYLLIDKLADGGEDVYFMNLVDEYDLLAFAEDFPENAPVNVGKDKKTSADGEDTDDETGDTDDENGEDTETPNSGNADNGGNTIILLVGAALLVGGGAFYYFKIYKSKSNKPKIVTPDDDEDDETEIEDPNDDEKSESDDTDDE